LIKYPRENIPYDELEKLMPWSDTLPEITRCQKSVIIKSKRHKASRPNGLDAFAKIKIKGLIKVP